MKKPALPQQYPIPKLRRDIGGEVYDTETASMLHHARVDLDNMLFAFGSILFVTVSDRYFIVDYNESGDPGSAWQRPVTVPEGIYWAEWHCQDLVEVIFGRLPSPGEGPRFAPIVGPFPG